MNIQYKNVEIRVLPEVYEPSEDSFLLAEAALSEVRSADKILEVGCGSGIVSAYIKANTRAIITGIDINPHAVKCTKQNGIDSIRGDLLSCIKGKFDMIIFNPPYLPTSDEERTDGWMNTAIDGGEDGRGVINRFLDQFEDCLENDGRIMLLLSSLSGIKQVISRLESSGYTIEIKARERFMFEQLKVLLVTRT